jgi:TetR/AcrR family tetracycline transcriptional repressor
VRLVIRGAQTRDVLVLAALNFVDEHGVSALTMRALGRAAGLHHTAIYRHFQSKEEILNAVFEYVALEALAGTPEPPEDPAERIIAMSLALRAGLHAHPAVVSAYLLPTAVVADSPPVKHFQGLIIDALSALGLAGHELAVRYQMLESYVLGSSAYDFSGAPDHLESRRQRHRLADGSALEAESRDVARIDTLNEESFALGLRTLVGQCSRERSG